MEDDRTGQAEPRSRPAYDVPGGLSYSDTKTAEALSDNKESQFQPVHVSPRQMDNVERVREAKESFALAPASEPYLKKPNRGLKLKINKPTFPNGMLYRVCETFRRK